MAPCHCTRHHHRIQCQLLVRAFVLKQCSVVHYCVFHGVVAVVLLVYRVLFIPAAGADEVDSTSALQLLEQVLGVPIDAGGLPAATAFTYDTVMELAQRWSDVLSRRADYNFVGECMTLLPYADTVIASGVFSNNNLCVRACVRACMCVCVCVCVCGSLLCCAGPMNAQQVCVQCCPAAHPVDVSARSTRPAIHSKTFSNRGKPKSFLPPELRLDVR